MAKRKITSITPETAMACLETKFWRDGLGVLTLSIG
jgi:hypothetical protein